MCPDQSMLTTSTKKATKAKDAASVRAVLVAELGEG
jgi:hypothetical protein